MKCAIYSRTSTDRQTITNQLNVLREIAERKGYEIVDEFADEGISGAKGRNERKGFDNLITGAVKKDFDLILVWSVDRLGRSLQDLVSFLNEIKSVNCNLYIHQSGLDTSTPTGSAMFAMIGIFAELERSIIKNRVIAGQQRAKLEGKHIGRPSKSVDKVVVEKVLKMRSQGIGIRKIATENSLGVNTIYSLLKKSA